MKDFKLVKSLSLNEKHRVAMRHVNAVKTSIDLVLLKTLRRHLRVIKRVLLRVVIVLAKYSDSDRNSPNRSWQYATVFSLQAVRLGDVTGASRKDAYLITSSL